MEKQATIIIRPFKFATDIGLVLDTFAKGVWNGGKIGRGNINKAKWFSEFHKELFPRLSDSTVKVACLQDDPNFIVGYAVFEKDILCWVWVKKSYRYMGIGKLLTANCETFSNIRLTEIGEKIYEKYCNEERFADTRG